MILHGRGFAADPLKAIPYFSKAAQHHHGPSMMMLGKMHTFGAGIPIDYALATYYFDQAIQTQDPTILESAIDAKSQLFQLLTKVQTNVEKYI